MRKQLQAIVIMVILAAAKSNPVDDAKSKPVSSELISNPLDATSNPVAATVDILKSGLNAFAFARQYLAHKTGPHNCGWPRATYMIGVWEYYAATIDAGIPDKFAKGDLVKWGKHFDYDLCTGDNKWTGPCATANTTSCADNQLAGATYIELYKAGLDLPAPHSNGTIQAIMSEFDSEISLGTSTEGSWPIIDLTFMAMAPLARLAALTGDQRYFDKLFANWNASFLQPRSNATTNGGSHSTYGLFNRTDHLFMRDDKHLWHDGYWGRGNGWGMLGLVDAIRFGDAGAVTGGTPDPHRARYVEVFKLFAARLLQLQGPDGAWRSSMLEPDQFPTPDATGSACFARGLAYGVNSGLLPRATYAPAVSKAWDFLSRVALQPSGLLGYCQPPGGTPANDFNANSTSDFCVGIFLGAAAEVSRMKSV